MRRSAKTTRAPIMTANPPTRPSIVRTSPVWMPARIRRPVGSSAFMICCAHRTARAGPSNVAKNPSPAVSTSFPRYLATSRARSRGAARAGPPTRDRRARLPVRVEPTMSVNTTVASVPVELSLLVFDPGKERPHLAPDRGGIAEPWRVLVPRELDELRAGDQAGDVSGFAELPHLVVEAVEHQRGSRHRRQDRPSIDPFLHLVDRLHRPGAGARGEVPGPCSTTSSSSAMSGADCCRFHRANDGEPQDSVTRRFHSASSSPEYAHG